MDEVLKKLDFEFLTGTILKVYFGVILALAEKISI